MAGQNIDVDPCDKLSADAVGKPGHRIFYLQAISNGERFTVLVEKIQLLTLASGIEKFLADLAQRDPRFETLNASVNEFEMRIENFDSPLFRAGDLGVGYDETRGRMVIFVRESILEGISEEETRLLRLWCTPEQANNLAYWIVEMASRGRPVCPQCGLPIEPEGHFCLKKNGHR